MKTEVKKLPRGQAELTIELTVEEYQPFLLVAASEISRTTKIEGFRPGKASLDVVKRRVGEGQLWQEALEPAVKKTFLEALAKENILTVGSPRIDVVKLAPNNPVVYKAVVSLLPSVTLPDITKIKVEKKKVEVTSQQIEQVATDLRKRRAKETLVDRPAKHGDKVEIDFTVSRDKIPIDNGSSKNFPLMIGENAFIPGFEEQMIGLKKGDTKNFQLTFPKNYHQQSLAGKPADFKVTVNSVFNLELPEFNDEFAKGLGNFKDAAALTDQIKNNLTEEASQKENQRLEEVIIDALVEKSSFDEIPDLLVDSETKKMLEELEHSLSHQGVKFDDYLVHLKKKREDLVLDFVPQAIKRAKGALITRAVAQDQKIEVTNYDIDEEIKKTLVAYAGNPEIEKQLQQPEYRDYVRNVLAARKVMDYLKSATVK